jgi:PAS domain S-box-containing protein
MTDNSYCEAAFRYNPIPTVIFEYNNAKGIIKKVNEAYATALNFTEDRLIGMDLFMIQDKSFFSDGVESFTRFQKSIIRASKSQVPDKIHLKTILTPGDASAEIISTTIGFTESGVAQMMQMLLFSNVSSWSVTNQSLIVRSKILIENLPNPIFLTTPDGMILEANQTACELFGYTEQELRSLGQTGLIDQNDPQSPQQVVERKHNGKANGILTGIRKNGERFPMEFSSVIFFDEQNRELSATIFHDISQRRKTEAQLMRSEHLFKSLVQDGTDLIAVLDLNGVYTYVSPAAVSITGFSSAESIGLSINEFIHEEDQHFVSDAIRNLSYKQRDCLEPCRYKHKNDGWCWMKITIANLLDDPVINGFIINAYDITEKIDAIRSLHESNERYHFVTRATLDAIWDWDIINNTIFSGEGFHTMFGYHPAKLDQHIGSWKQYIHPDDYDHVINTINDSIQSGSGTWSAEYRYKRSDDTYVYVFSRAMIIRNTAGEAIRMVGATRDISAQKSEDIQRTLLTEISHLFSNPSSTLKQIGSRIVETIQKFTSHTIVELWLISTDKKRLLLFAQIEQELPMKEFYEDTADATSFEKGQGLPGMVWEKRAAQKWKSPFDSVKCLRAEAARHIGIDEIIGIPLISVKDFIGVLVVGSSTKKKVMNPIHPIFYNFAERLAAEIKRKQLEDELMQIFQTSPDVICIAGPNGYFTKVNPTLCNLLGYSAEELTSRPFSDFVYVEDQQATSVEYYESIQGLKRSQGFVNRYVTSSGELKWISWNSSPFIGEAGHSFAYGRDVTANKELQDLLDEANKLAKIGGWEANLETNTILFSGITKQIHEVEKDFVPTLEVGISFYREDVRHIVRQHIEQTLKDGSTWDFELPIITAKGNERWVRNIGKADFKNGKCTRLYGSFQDIHERKIVELRLLHTSNNIPGVIFQYISMPDGNDRIINLTKQTTEIWGYTPEECMENISLIWNQIKSGGDYDAVIESIKLSGSTLQQWHCEFRSVKPSGKVIWLEGFGTPQKLQNGAILWDSVIIDITPRKKLEYLVERAGKMARIGNWEIDLIKKDEPAVYWSPMTREILEVDDDYVPDLKKGYDFYTAESKLIIESAISKLINNGVDFDHELIIVTARGNKCWVRCIGQGELVNGICVKIFGSFQDIQAQKLAEENSLKALKEKKAILESISDAFFAVDNNWIITYWNKEAEAILDKPKAEVLGKNLWEVYPDVVDSVFYKKYHMAIAEGQAIHFEAKYDTLDMWLEISAYPSTGGLSVYFKNVNNRKKTEQQMQKMYNELSVQTKQLASINAELEQFAYVASHDLQEPLRMVSSFLMQLDKNYKEQLDERAKQYIHFAVDGAQRMRQIILDLLEYSRIGRVEQKKEVIDLNDIVKELQVLYRAQIEEVNAEITTADLPKVYSSKAPIRQVFHNLFSNAIKYKDKNRPLQINIGVSEAEEQWIFSISDNGIGIHEEYHKKVFVIFQRLHSKGEYPGTGMGLTICKKIVENMGGKIWVDSKEGQGSTFYFTVNKEAEVVV